MAERPTARLDPVALDRLAVESTRRRIAGLKPGDLDRATVNAKWDVRAVIAHLVGGNLLYAKAIRGETADWSGRDTQRIDSALEQFDASGQELAEAIDGLADVRQPVSTSAGTMPAINAVAVHATDMLVHGWDVAVATDQDRRLDPELCRAAIAIIERFPPTTWGDARFYAQRVPIATDDPTDQLVALTGRDPSAGR